MNSYYALLYGISALAGLSIPLFAEARIAAAFWFVFLLFIQDWRSTVCMVLFTAYGVYSERAAKLEEGQVSGIFSIQELKTHQSPFYQDLSYRGTILVNGRSAPCTFYRKTNEKIDGSSNYQVTGTLQKRNEFDFILKPKTLTPIEKTYSLAEFRYQMKQQLKSFLKQTLKHKESSNLLFALASGEVDDRLLRFQFSRVGLQHILAISGFHFGLLISFLSSILGIFLSRNIRWGVILAIMSLYFIFIGSAPAIERAWLMASLFFIAKWLKREIKPLNLLGLTLLIELVIHPYIIANLGFQLSYLSCFGILALSEPIEHGLTLLFPKRRFADTAKSPLFEQLFFLTSSFFRQGLAVSLAVNCMIFPILLFHFGTFPPLSFVYNLFYPHLIGALLFLFLFTSLVHLLIPLFAVPFFSLLNAFAKFLCHLVANPPPILDTPLQISHIPIWPIPFYLFTLFFLSCAWPKFDR